MGLASLFSSGGVKPAHAVLSDLDVDGDPIAESQFQFQYYPETISDSRSVNYASKDVIGGSHPIYQWIHGSERTISFDAVFSADFNTEGKSKLDEALDTTTRLLQIAKNPLVGLLGSLGEDDDGISVANQIGYLQSKTYPRYKPNVAVIPPPTLMLYLPGSRIRSGVAVYELDFIPVLMRRCDVHYEAFFNNGRPRVATVSLEFIVCIQVGRSWGFANRDDVAVSWDTAKPGSKPAPLFESPFEPELDKFRKASKDFSFF